MYINYQHTNIGLNIRITEGKYLKLGANPKYKGAYQYFIYTLAIVAYRRQYFNLWIHRFMDFFRFCRQPLQRLDLRNGHFTLIFDLVLKRREEPLNHRDSVKVVFVHSGIFLSCVSIRTCRIKVAQFSLP